MHALDLCSKTNRGGSRWEEWEHCCWSSALVVWDNVSRLALTSGINMRGTLDHEQDRGKHHHHPFHRRRLGPSDLTSYFQLPLL